jgi:hypothetical protein
MFRERIMSEILGINQDIKRVNKSLEEGDRGFLLSFPQPNKESILPQDFYTFSFDIPNRGKLPEEPPVTVIFTPQTIGNTEKSSFIGSSIDTNINVGIAIKSVHRAETKTLVRLEIKNKYNKVLYTDYILVVCSPTSRFSLSAQLLSRYLTNSIGPNGGRILRINSSEENSNVNLISQLFTRMRVEGPGIPSDAIVTIFSFINDNRTDIELLPFFENPAELNQTTSFSGTYSFTNVFGCPSEEDLKEISQTLSLIVLQQENNWSYFFRQKLIVQFVPEKTLNDWENIVIILNTKNFDALIKTNQASRIPSVAFIDAKGRVINDSICLNSL